MASWKGPWNHETSSDEDSPCPDFSEDSVSEQSMTPPPSSPDREFIEIMEGPKEPSETDSELVYPESEEEEEYLKNNDDEDDDEDEDDQHDDEDEDDDYDDSGDEDDKEKNKEVKEEKKEEGDKNPMVNGKRRRQNDGVEGPSKKNKKK